MAVSRLPGPVTGRHTRLMGHFAEAHNKQILDQFTRQAEPFALALAHSTEGSLSVFLAAARVTADDVALDAARGPGIISCALAGMARHVTGIDLVPAMLDEARKLQTKKG